MRGDGRPPDVFERRVNLAEQARRCHLWAGFRGQFAQIGRILTDNFGCDIQN
jgi:hypothetical protein